MHGVLGPKRYIIACCISHLKRHIFIHIHFEPKTWIKGRLGGKTRDGTEYGGAGEALGC